MEEERSLMESIFWGDISPVDMLAHKSRAAQKSYEAYVQAHKRLSEKLKAIDPGLDGELEAVLSAHYGYAGDMQAHAFAVGCSMGLKLMQEAVHTPVGA